MEQSVFMSFSDARPIEHMLLNSPVTARAAVAVPSKKAPATADLRYALTMVSSLGGSGVGGLWESHTILKPRNDFSVTLVPDPRHILTTRMEPRHHPRRAFSCPVD